MSLVATAFGTKVAIAALSLVALGGGAAAAANGALPATPVPSSETSTPTVTPAPDETATPTPTPTEDPTPSATKGPDATGSAAFGLCTAYTAGGLNSGSVAYSALLDASQSAGDITDYCAPILAAHAEGDEGTEGDDLDSLSELAPQSKVPSLRGESDSDHGSESSELHGH
ncbi:MAG TPA: hypothetical protein VNT53_11505 [Pseudolysinimonas sp.]|nr:hypothetical protein [Pseudolysinimonas sp.]